MSEQTPLERAIFAVVKHILGDDIPADEHTCCVAVAKRELEKAVPARSEHVERYEDCLNTKAIENRGFNECRKLMGLE